MSNFDENLLSAQINEPNSSRGGGFANSEIISSESVSSGMGEGSGLQNNASALVRPSVGPGNGESPLLGQVLNNFSFVNPFQAARHAVEVASHPLTLPAAVPSSAPAPSASDQPGQTVQALSGISGQQFSQLSAEGLYQVIKGKITNFTKEVWIQEDISGQAILESVDPSALCDFLINVAKISSMFIRPRVESIIFAMVQKDDSIDPALRKKWSDFQQTKSSKELEQPHFASPNTPMAFTAPAVIPTNLFRTPPGPANQTMSAYFTDIAHLPGASDFIRRPATPSFMNEVPSRVAFPLSDSAIFGDTRPRATCSATPAQVVGSGSANSFHITLNQPSAEPPKWVILESPTDSKAFYKWIKKNRAEMLRVDDVDRKKLNTLVGEDVREEVSRIICEHKQKMPSMFHVEFPYPSLWKHVSDEYLLMILFGLHGPRSADEAKERLQAKLFFFNDSTQWQDTFTAIIRKFCNGFKTTLQDFSFNTHQWPQGEELTRTMIVDAFTKCFDNKDTIKGPDGSTMVPKCSNMAIVREQIRQKKALPLEQIINHILDHFEKNDILIRSRKGLNYNIKPWNLNARKPRQFNQVAPAHQRNGVAKPPRPPTNFPRCANCGSKGHLCGERTCYTFGHPKGRGASGVWPEGEKSLALNPNEWKEWNASRHAIFYGYSENQAKKRELPKDR